MAAYLPLFFQLERRPRGRKYGTAALQFLAHGEDSQFHETLAIARELVKRWLDEELRRGDALMSPEAVRSYLRLMFAGEEREVFVALFLDTQNRLIAGEKLFFGTLAQTSG